MKKCQRCGHTFDDNVQFCENCGQFLSRNIVDSIADKFGDVLSGHRTYQAQSDEIYSQQGSEDSRGNFISSDETVQATIGTNCIQNYMSGAGFKNGAAVLTNKRLYYFGKSFSNIGKGANTTTEEGIVSVDEITFTRFVHGSPLSYLILAVVCLLLGVVLFGSVVGSTSEFAGFWGFISLVLVVFGIAFLTAYFLGRSTVLEIAFPGGKYCFDSRGHSVANMQKFQRQIHLVKDSLKADQDNKTDQRTENGHAQHKKD